MASTLSDSSNIDRQIEQLMECKLLTESEVKSLCEKVLIIKILLIFFVSG